MKAQWTFQKQPESAGQQTLGGERKAGLRRAVRQPVLRILNGAETEPGGRDDYRRDDYPRDDYRRDDYRRDDYRRDSRDDYRRDDYSDDDSSDDERNDYRDDRDAPKRVCAKLGLRRQRLLAVVGICPRTLNFNLSRLNHIVKITRCMNLV